MSARSASRLRMNGSGSLLFFRGERRRSRNAVVEP